MKKIYLDNAATTYPKPEQIFQAMLAYGQNIGANPGRSAHQLAYRASEVLFETRSKLAQLFNVPDPARLIFTANATEALNLALYGWLRPGDHVVASSLEHNAVMRPLQHLVSQGVSLSVVPCQPDGTYDLDLWQQALQPHTRLLVVNHASNVIGSLAPIKELATIAGDIPLLVDAAQTAGSVPLDVQEQHIALLAFTGHKGLYGPAGTGGLYIREDLNLDPLKRGGTGSHSAATTQPDFLPDKFESGTPNTIGIAGLGAGIDFVLAQGVTTIRVHEQALCSQLWQGLAQIPRVQLYGPMPSTPRVAVVSFNIQGLEASEVGYRLDQQFDICCRVGLHCAPLAHQTIGTFPHGTVRLSLGYFNTHDQIQRVIQAVQEIADAQL